MLIKALSVNSLVVEKRNAYVIGRSESNAASFLAELRQMNPKGKFDFVEADVSRIRNVDEACKEIMRKEKKKKKLNLIFMTAGGISLSGRNGKSYISASKQPLQSRHY